MSRLFDSQIFANIIGVLTLALTIFYGKFGSGLSGADLSGLVGASLAMTKALPDGWVMS